MTPPRLFPFGNPEPSLSRLSLESTPDSSRLPTIGSLPSLQGATEEDISPKVTNAPTNRDSVLQRITGLPDPAEKAKILKKIFEFSGHELVSKSVKGGPNTEPALEAQHQNQLVQQESISNAPEVPTETGTNSTADVNEFGPSPLLDPRVHALVVSVLTVFMHWFIDDCFGVFPNESRLSGSAPDSDTSVALGGSSDSQNSNSDKDSSGTSEEEYNSLVGLGFFVVSVIIRFVFGGYTGS